CEDTRQTLKLLARYNLQKKLISYYRPKEGHKIPQILGLLKTGGDVALVSDSGTPGISDPGYLLIREAIAADIQIVPVPGPSAVIAALSASGLPTHRFLFFGFPSPKREKTRKLLQSLEREEATLIFYLPTRKIQDFLVLLEETLGNRPAVIAREITKVHEEFLRGTVRELREQAEKRDLKGEATILVRGYGKLGPGPHPG
ncbi:MAG: ribosomal RNA small subunit methyltransferase I, partial [Acidobacteriota bacterium]